MARPAATLLLSLAVVCRINSDTVPGITEISQATKIIKNGTIEWAVSPGKSITLICSGKANATWEYPKVIDGPMPNERFFPNNELHYVSQLRYNSISPNSSGYHRCLFDGQVEEIFLHVSDNLTCQSGYDKLPGIGCYQVKNIVVGWNDAENICKNEGSHLAVTNTQAEMDALISLWQQVYQGRWPWVGIRRTNGKWVASDGLPYGSSGFTGWRKAEPAGKGECAFVIRPGLHDWPCEKTRPIICQAHMIHGACPPGYETIHNRSCYKPHDKYATWEQAKQLCEAEDAWLAVTVSWPQVYILVDMKTRQGWEDWPWVGIRKINGTWTTVQGTIYGSTGFTGWRKAEPSETGDCVYLWVRGLANYNCNESRPFLCEQSPDLSSAIDSLITKWMVAVIVAACMAACLLPVLMVMGYKLHRKREERRSLLAGKTDNTSDENSLAYKAELLPFSSKWEFPAKRLKLGRFLGAGEFGVVRMARARFIIPGQALTTVAVKSVGKAAGMESLHALVHEMKVLAHLGHHLNVVNLLGASTKGIAKGKLHMIVEYCPFGNLKDYLTNHRTTYQNQIDPSNGSVLGKKNGQ